MKFMRLLGGLVILIFLAGCSSVPSVSKIETISPKIFSTTTLDNGLEVVVDENHSHPVVAIQLWVRAGSIYEGEKLGSGISHYLEHLAFKGHGGTSDGEIPRALEELGGSVNAYTSWDRTVYYIRLPAQNWKKGLVLLRRLVLEIEFDQAAMAKEKEVIMREIGMGRDNPDRRLSQLLWSTAFQIHPYRYPVIGFPAPFNALTREDVESYYRHWYVPNNMFLVASGDINTEEFMSFSAEVFSPDIRRDYPLAMVPAEPAQIGFRQATEEMDVANTRVALGFHIPSIHHPDLYALDVLAILAGQGRSSKLYRRLREQEELVLQVSVSSYTPFYPGLFMVNAVCRPELEGKAASGMLEEIFSYREQKVGDDELEKARQMALMNYLESKTTAEGRAYDLGLNLLYADDLNFSRKYVEGISRVTSNDVLRVARRYLQEANMSLAVVRPPQDQEEEMIESNSSPPQISRHVLSNGMTLLVREDHSLPLISIRAVFRGGVLGEKASDSGASNFVARLLLKGTSNRTAEEISSEIEDYGGAIGSYSARNSCGVWLTVNSSRLRSGLEVLGDILRASLFEPEEIQKERGMIIAGIRSETDRPVGLARRLLLPLLFPDSPYRFSPSGSEESVEQLSRSRLLDYYQRYYRGNNGVLAVFGDVKATEVLEVAEKYLGGIPSGEKLFLPDVSSPAKGVRIEQGQKEGVEQEALLLGFSGVDLFSPDRYALEVLASYFSGLSSPLFLKVRASEGLVYSIGAFQVLGLLPGGFIFYAETRPGAAPKVVEFIQAEIDRVINDGITPQELKVIQNRLIGQDLFRREQNSGQAFSSALDELYGLGYENSDQYPQYISEVTIEDIKAAARKYLTEDNYALVMVGPSEIENEQSINKEVLK